MTETERQTIHNVATIARELHTVAVGFRRAAEALGIHMKPSTIPAELQALAAKLDALADGGSADTRLH